MKALVTGASSGIGLEMSRYLSSLWYDLIVVSRNKKKLEELQDELKTKVKAIVMDLSVESNVKSLYVLCKNENIDMNELIDTIVIDKDSKESILESLKHRNVSEDTLYMNIQKIKDLAKDIKYGDKDIE